MTREEAKGLLPIIQAWAEGKTIQFLSNGEWDDIDQADFACSPDKYRIKPQSEYRPFKTKEECWNEMLKHQPFGWLKSKKNGSFCCIGLVSWTEEWREVLITLATSISLSRSSSSIYEEYTFANGTPFGIKEEQL